MTYRRVTDTRLRKEILAELDGLGDALVSDRLLAARMLLDWAANAGKLAMNAELSQATIPFVQRASAGETYYEQFLPREGAVSCGGIAIFYDRLLKIFGYDSFTIDFGDQRDGLTHATVVVSFWDGTVWKHHILDPTFNTTLHDRATGCQLDVFELMDALEGDSMDTVVVRAESVDSRDWISIGPRKDPHKDPHFFLREVAGERYIYGQTDRGLMDYLERNAAGLAANGYSGGLRGFVQLIRARMFSVGPSTSNSARQDFIDQLQARGIPLGDG